MTAFSFISRWPRWFQTLDLLLHKHWPLVIGLVLMCILRLPNVSEPYWYGDEGIYLTIGQSLRSGERLYAEIIDHKTPLIYYLAMVPNQESFRWLLLGWMIITTTAFYGIVKQWWSSKLVQTLAVLTFVLITTLPRLEGNIPNGELFVMGFVVVGIWLVSQTHWWQEWLALPSTTSSKANPSHLMMFGGFALSLGILTKVPGLFDAVSVFWAAWLAGFRTLTSSQAWSKKLRFFFQLLKPNVLVFIGLILPILLTVIYFVWRGSGQAYLDFGLLYNFRYAGSWNLPFNHPWLLAAFTLPGKAAIMAIILLSLSYTQKWLTPRWSWLLGWLVLTLFASILSNRPYPHYFLQIAPPLSLIIAGLVGLWLPDLKQRQHGFQRLAMTTAGVGALGLVWVVFRLLGVWFYPTQSYYLNWWKLVSGQMTVPAYRQTFNSIMADNYAVTEIIKQDPAPYLFIWGTNPMLYAQTGKIPTGRFTVSFHIKDFNAYQETLASVTARRPTYIVVMNDEGESWSDFSAYLNHEYTLSHKFDHFTLWRRLSAE